MKRSMETTCIQGGWQPKNGEPRILPIYQSTTFKYSTSEQMGRLFDLEENGYFYTRLANPTNDAGQEDPGKDSSRSEPVQKCLPDWK